MHVLLPEGQWPGTTTTQGKDCESHEAAAEEEQDDTSTDGRRTARPATAAGNRANRLPAGTARDPLTHPLSRPDRPGDAADPQLPARPCRARGGASSPEGWHVQEDFLAYTASNQLQIHLGDQSHPLPVEEALSTIREFSASTVLTARIALALWHQRRYEQHLAKNGAAAVKLDEILAMRGFKKRSIPVSSGTEEIRYTVGYRPEDKQAILLDLALLQQCYVSGERSIHVRGKWQQFTIEGPY